MSWLGQFHPQIVHTPVALIIFSAFFAIAGRLFDREWVRKTATLLLVFGFLGAYVAVQSGQVAHRVPEHQQGVPEDEIDEHAESGRWALWTSGAALVAVIVAGRLAGGAGKAVGAVALLLQIVAAASVGMAGKRGGDLVYLHGANVRIGGVLVKDTGAGAGRGEREGVSPAPGDSAAAEAKRKGGDKDDD